MILEARSEWRVVGIVAAVVCFVVSVAVILLSSHNVWPGDMPIWVADLGALIGFLGICFGTGKVLLFRFRLGRTLDSVPVTLIYWILASFGLFVICGALSLVWEIQQPALWLNPNI